MPRDIKLLELKKSDDHYEISMLGIITNGSQNLLLWIQEIPTFLTLSSSILQEGIKTAEKPGTSFIVQNNRILIKLVEIRGTRYQSYQNTRNQIKTAKIPLTSSPDITYTRQKDTSYTEIQLN